MNVVAHLCVPADAFELGRILALEGGSQIELEDMVPLGERAVPFFSVSNDTRLTFEQSIRDHPTVGKIEEVSSHGPGVLYALEWDISEDEFFDGIYATEAQLLNGTGTAETWEFEVRFTSYEDLSVFQEHCTEAEIPLEIGRIYNPARPGTGSRYGLTQAQRTTLMRAVEGGYYGIPRGISTAELAQEFGISDQAVTERLRRAIGALVNNTLAVTLAEEDTEEFLPAE